MNLENRNWKAVYGPRCADPWSESRGHKRIPEAGAAIKIGSISDNGHCPEVVSKVILKWKATAFPMGL